MDLFKTDVPISLSPIYSVGLRNCGSDRQIERYYDDGRKHPENKAYCDKFVYTNGFSLIQGIPDNIGYHLPVQNQAGSLMVGYYVLLDARH